MIESISESVLSEVLRRSLWLYPLVNTGHVVGIALLVGAIVPMDLRLLGCWSRIPHSQLAAVLVPVARVGFLMAVICGVPLFITRPQDYSHSIMFQSKIILVSLGVLNALVLTMSSGWRHLMLAGYGCKRVKIHALISLSVWLTVLLLGRLLGYR